jgi:Fe-S cluster assembly protein SufD
MMSADIQTDRTIWEPNLDNSALPVSSQEMRMLALEAFRNLGFPTRRNEDWKYTDLSPFLKKTWDTNITAPASLSRGELLNRLIPGMAANIMVFVDGRFQPEHSLIIEKDSSILISSLSEAAEKHPELLEAHLGKYADFEITGTVAVNTALAEEGLFVYIPKNKKLSDPVHALYFHSGGQRFIQYRNLIIADESAELAIAESSIALNDDAAFTNMVSEISASHGAIVNYYKIQEDNDSSLHVNHTQFYQLSDSLCNSFTVCLSGRMIRNDLNYTLADERCESHLFGVYIPAGDEHFDNHTFVDHAKPQCFSNEIYKGVMSGRSTAVFNGKILVRPDAQKTNAYQSNKNVLLSPDAKIDTKPQLEIFADDVKCSHGATVGRLNEEAVFYMRSRGIDENTARTMLTFAFAEEVLETAGIEPLKHYLASRIEEKLSRSAK